MSCILDWVLADFTKKTINRMTDKQLETFGLSKDSDSKAGQESYDAIKSLANSYLNSEIDEDVRDEMADDPDSFIAYLESSLAKLSVDESSFEERKKQYEDTLEYLEDKKGKGRIGTFEFEDSEEGEKEALREEIHLQSVSDLIKIEKEYYKKSNRVKRISFILKEPIKSDRKTVQQRTVQILENVSKLTEESRYPAEAEYEYKGEIYYTKDKDEHYHWIIPKGGKLTGRYKRRYRGKLVLAESVSHVLDREENKDPNEPFPLLGGFIGSVVDTIARDFFSRHNGKNRLYDENGKLREEELQSIIQQRGKNGFGGLFTVKGLKNLLRDFERLEEELIEKWGDKSLEGGGIKVFSGEVPLLGKIRENNEDLWVTGIPDLLVVDKHGIVHVLDFKTKKMSNKDKYEHPLNDDYGSGERYGKQISMYIRMLRSYGLNVSSEPHVILIDTWYDSSDFGEANYDDDHNLIEGRNSIYYKDDKLKVAGLLAKDPSKPEERQDNPEQEMSLADYAKEMNNPGVRDVLDETTRAGRTILYMEPRLHITYEGKEEGFSDELSALRDEEDTPYKPGPSYADQLAALPQEERDNLKWLGGDPVEKVETAQEVRTLKAEDIESRPDLISPQEIQSVANLLMYKISRTISELQKGETVEEFPESVPSDAEGGKSIFEGKSRKYIIETIGIDRFIEYAFSFLNTSYQEDFPTLEEYRSGEYDDFDYSFEDEQDFLRQQKDNEKVAWLIEEHHKEQLIEAGSSKLMALEKCVIPKKNKEQEQKKFNETEPAVREETDVFDVSDDTGDNKSNEEFSDMFLDGLANTEAWMMGVRNYSPRTSLAQEIRRMYEDLVEIGEDGKAVMDPWGWGIEMHVDSTHAIQATMDACQHCETVEDMLKALEDMKKNGKNLWVDQILERLKRDDNLKKKFYKHFRKDALTYSISEVKFNKKTGEREVLTRVINMRSAYDTMLQSLSASFYNGSVGEYEVDGVTMPFISKNREGNNVLTPLGNYTVRRRIKNDLFKIETAIKKIYKEKAKKGGDKVTYALHEMEHTKVKELGNKTILEALTNVIKGVGILVTPEIVKDVCALNMDSPQRNNVIRITTKIGTILDRFQDLQEKKKKESLALSGKGAPFGFYKDLLLMFSDTVQEYVEASVYQDGKTYYSYTNPSRLEHIVRNLKNALGDDTKFKKYLHSNFGRYTGWYKSVDGEEWLCDWLDQFENSEEARTAFAHKVELSYIGTQYKNLGSLGFQLSILHNYFGSKDDEAVGNGNYRWFAMPTMSNKPVNEFLRMKKYEGATLDEIKKEITDKVLMKTFQQELNRMADVLNHYASGKVAVDKMDLTDKKLRDTGWSEEEIKDFKTRIDRQQITIADLNRLAAVESGAKFHFLWYLNASLADKGKEEDSEEVREEKARMQVGVANMINLLLTPNGKEKEAKTNLAEITKTKDLVRKSIQSNMENIVKDELAEMERIGLFETTNKKIEGKNVTVYKYQEEFSGNLGSYKTKDDNKNPIDPDDSKKAARKEMEEALTEFIWQDIAANINIIQITGGDLAYYGNAVNYQKRIAQIHSPGLHMVHDPEIDDGYLRNVHITDRKVMSEVKWNAQWALEYYMENSDMTEGQKKEFKKMINIILNQFDSINVTDGQSFSCLSSMRKKLRLQGEWDDERQEAYERILKGDFNINNLGVMMQPTKPFETSIIAKYSGSNTMDVRAVPIQNKNSEYLIILAEALSRGGGFRSKLTAINDFMEATHKFGDGRSGIDTVHFESVGKVGNSGVIDIDKFDKNYDAIYRKAVANRDKTVIKIVDGKEEIKDEHEAYSALLTEYLLDHVRRNPKDKSIPNNSQKEDELLENEKNRIKENGGLPVLTRPEALYNNYFVDTVPVDDYIIQQEVPAHLFDKNGSLYGSQIRILGISDITPGTKFRVWNAATGTYEIMDDKSSEDKKGLIDEYKELHAKNIYESMDSLLEEFGLKGVMDSIKTVPDLLKEMGKEEWIERYEEEQAKNENKPVEEILEKLGLIDVKERYKAQSARSIMDRPIGDPVRNEVLKNMALLLQKEMSKDAKYGLDMRRACTLRYDDNGNAIDFVVPLMDPIQSQRIQMLINSIIKKEINKQRITGGPVVQVTAYDKDLHIRFKGADGKPLHSYTDYVEKLQENWKDEGHTEPLSEERCVAQYQEYLRLNKASIAHFECYMPIPNPELERLVTNPDGSIMSIEEMKKVLPKDVWESMSQVIGYRIPTEDKYSMAPLKIVGFVPRAAGQVIIMPKEITLLSGSDFDIDKMYIMMKAFNVKPTRIKKEDRATYWKTLVQRYHKETGNRWNEDWSTPVNQIISMSLDLIKGRKDHWSRESLTLTGNTKWEEIQKFIEWYRNDILKNSFSEYTDMEHKDRFKAKKARDNRILDLEWAVLTNTDTMPKILNPGNFEPQKLTGRRIKMKKANLINPATNKVWTWDEISKLSVKEIDAILEKRNPHNTTLPSSKIYFQNQNMQGTQMTGIFANNIVSHAFLTFQHVGIDLQKGDTDFTFSLCERTIGESGTEDRITRLDPQKAFDGQLISKNIATYIQASLDTAKEPSLADQNVNTFTGGIAMLLTRIGYSVEDIGLFLSQPIIIELTDLYFRNSNQGYYTGNVAVQELAAQLGIDKVEFTSTENSRDKSVLTKKNLIEHLTDEDFRERMENNLNDETTEFQKAVLSTFYRLLQMAGNLQDLTFLTKFNSVNNAGGPKISDTMKEQQRVESFINDIEKTCFYEPEGKSEFTNAADAIDNDQILSAFYYATVAEGGTSDMIFRNFFPHYFPGFKNVLTTFQTKYLGGAKINGKLQDQLLNDYVYFLLTYHDSDNPPTLPSSETDKRKLVEELVKDFKEVRDIPMYDPKTGKGRRRNVLLDQSYGTNCLRIREADDFLQIDILTFNSGQLNADAQEQIKVDWNDLITMNDPNLTEEQNNKIRVFATKLFFYTLMRNGFGFSPRTLMHLATTLVRENATYAKKWRNYIKGLQKVKDLDVLLMAGMTDEEYIERFCDQFARNHANNRQLVPNISYDDKILYGVTGGVAQFKVSADEEHELYRLKQSGGEPKGFVTITKKEGTKLTQKLYKLKRVNGQSFREIGDDIIIEYEETSKLGLTNNFIEYDANGNIPVSFFEDKRDESEVAYNDEETNDTEGRGEVEAVPAKDNYDSKDEANWINITRVIKELEGPQKGGKEGKKYRINILKPSYLNAAPESEVKKDFEALLESLSPEAKQQIMDKINERCNI